MDRQSRQMRAIASKFNTRDSEEGLFLECYFSVFNSIYELWDGATESVAPGAFTNTLGGDIRALIDHETRLVLGRNKAGTLELREDAHGLWGRVKVNPNDQDAVNLYERVKRGDVDQCSFGFDIVREDTEIRQDNTVHWTIREVKLYEVSVVTFPAYTDTSVSARRRDFDEIRKREIEKWRLEMRSRVKGEAYGTESADAAKADQ